MGSRTVEFVVAEITEQQLIREREGFLTSGAVPTGVREEISASWRRCLSWSVPVDQLTPPYRPDTGAGTRLGRAAAPVLDALMESLGDLHIGFLLSDAEGLVVDRRVRPSQLVRRMDSVNIQPGFVLSEDATGTNAVGTAIELGRTTRIDGHEHYASILVDFTCIGVPITDPVHRRCVGVFDVTVPADRNNHLIAVIAEQAARAVQRRLLEEHSWRERALLARFHQLSRSGRGAFVVLNERVIMSNPRAARLLDGVEQSTLWEEASQIMTGARWNQVALADGRVASTRTTPLHEDGELVGAVIELRTPVVDHSASCQPKSPDHVPRTPIKTAPTVSATHAAPAEEGALPPLLGRDPIFMEAVRHACAVPPGIVLVVRGEQGTGKCAVATMAAKRHGREPRAIDAAGASADEQHWLAELQRALADSAGAVVVRHVELLSSDTMRRLAAVLGTATEAGWWVALTCTATETPPLPGVEQEMVWLPPLRERRGDLAALLAEFTAPRRVATEVVQVLARLPWRGNIPELRAVARRLAQSALAHGTIGLQCVPNDLRRAATRPNLTRFERAEINAIIDALAEANGNRKEAAALLGISRTTLYRKLQAAGVDLDNTLY
jgi:transcriptional regulator of acetoin/glycerol metabolism